MLIDTITFEIRNFATGSFQEFVVENTNANYTLIAAHRFTRSIRLTKMFDFEFTAKEKTPKFILFGEIVATAYFENKDVEELDLIDEMIGIY